MKSPEQLDPQRPKVDWWLPEAGEPEGVGCYYLMSTVFQFFKMKRVLEMDGGDGSTINVLNTTKLYPQNGKFYVLCIYSTTVKKKIFIKVSIHPKWAQGWVEVSRQHD